MHEPTTARSEKDTAGLEVALELVTRAPRVGGEIKLRMTVHNPTQARRSFCTYHTPFEGLLNDIFSVSASKGDVPYHGPMVKRAPPGPKDYIQLAPGESRQATVDLAEGYEIPSGGFAVSYRGSQISGLPFSGPVSLSVKP